MRLWVLAATTTALPATLLGPGCLDAQPVALTVDAVVTPEALDIINIERPFDLTLEVTLISERADATPQVFTATETAASNFSERLAVDELVSPCSVTGNGSTARLLFNEESVAEYAIVLGDDETSTLSRDGDRCAYDGVVRHLNVVPAADGASVRFDEVDEV